MADENTAANSDTQAKDKEIKELKEKLEKESNRVQNAEKKFNEWSNELGDIRKQREELKVALADAQKMLEDLKAAPLKAGHKPEGNEAEDLDTVEKSLSESQRKVVEEGFNALTDAEKKRYEEDPKFRLVFLKRSQELAPVIPTSPWKTAPKKQTPDVGVDEILNRVFDKKKRSSFVPPGSSGGIVNMVKGQPMPYEPPEDTRVK
jgi:chromosome segregation ATPase